MSKPKLGIIGGKGKMGSWLKEQLKSSVDEVLIYDLDEQKPLEKFLNQCQLIGVSVPISETEALLESLRSLVKEEQCVFDLTSLKERPCDIMSTFSCAAIGMHPLFGPQVQDPAFKTLVFCSVRQSQWDEWFKILWKKKNYHVLDMDPKEHDQKMAWIQAINPLLHLTLGVSIQGTFSKDLEHLMTPSFSLFFQTLSRFMTQNPKLYFEMAAYNPYFSKTYDVFQSQMNCLKQAIQNKQESVFEETFQKLQSFIQEIHS